MDNVKYAGFSRRLAAVCLDHMLFGFMVVVIGFVLSFPALLLGFISMFNTATITIFTLGLWLGGMALFFGAHWLYYAGFEASNLQATPGKIALGLRVCDTQLRKITLRQSSIRYLSHYLSTLLFCSGYLISFFTARRQTLHDLISDTLVVRLESPALAQPVDLIKA